MNTLMSRTLHSSLFTLALFLFAILLAPTPARAQTETTGAFEGQVTNIRTGEAIAGVAIQFINQETQVQSAARTDSQGRFTRYQLQPGTYIIRVRVAGYKPFEKTQGIFITQTRQVVPLPVGLEPEDVVVQSTPAPTPGESTAATTPALPTPTPTPLETDSDDDEPGLGAETATDGRRGGSFTDKEVSTLPLGATTLVRTFDELALLLPGVAPPPQTQGSVAGPGVGAGVGSAGQFSVNGLRSRANNFTVDGSDNNDEDIGVRRQGFLTLVPQPIESIQGYQVTTLLAPAQYGRNFGAQVNAVSKSGGNEYHGTFFGFFNSSQLNAREFFDSTNGNAASILRANNQNVVLRTQRGDFSSTDTPLTVRNGSGGEDSSTFAQGGFVLGGPLVPINSANPNRQNSLYFFISVEGQLLNANKEASFAVPTVAERGLLGFGATGVTFTDASGIIRPAPLQSRSGAGVLSLFPFPNNPNGIYGENTFTRTLPASGFGKVLSGKTNGNFYVRGRRQDITARYNFTDDARTIPVTGGAVFSSLRPRVRTQNFSTFLSSEITDTISNEVRASYGRTRLVFDEVPDREFLIPTSTQFTDPRDGRFLLNAPYLANITVPGGPPTFVRLPDDLARNTTEAAIGLIGQIKIGGFSPLGVDVFNFPQARVNNTYQLADTLNVRYGAHRFAFGADLRRVELNSDLPRNSRPLLVYGGEPGRVQELASTGVRLRPVDFAAIGSPSGALQTYSTTGSAAINLRYYEYNFFAQDEWRVRPNLSLSYGVRYEYNSPPNELNRRIESTFNSSALSLLPGLRPFLNGRTEIFDPDRNNIAPRVGIAYARRLFGSEQETVFRAGYGMYYDQILGAVVSQSRNVFPNFLTLNFGGGRAQFSGPNSQLDLFNPSEVGFCRNADCTIFDPFRAPGTLNQINTRVAGSFQDFFPIIDDFFPAAGFGITLPARELKTPMAQHYSFTVEQPLGRSMVLSAAYVGTSGRHLLRITTPNAGENVQLLTTGFTVGGNVFQGFFPVLLGTVVSPSSPDTPTFTRRTAGVGAVNLIETSANSRYDALQLQLRGRFRRGLQYQAAYTFSETTDDVSDVFDLAGAPSLPQDSEHLDAERGPSNFDVRHRFSYNLVYSLSDLSNHSRAVRALFGGLEIASTGQFQTGQPFTVNSIFDVNGDGNFTDRLNSTTGLVETGDRSRPLQLTGAAAADRSILLAPDFQNGSVGRNTFRTGNLLLLNLAVIKNFRITETQALTFRTEIFNITDRANFGVPVRFLESPGFGQATETVTPGRRVQFALKYSF